MPPAEPQDGGSLTAPSSAFIDINNKRVYEYLNTSTFISQGKSEFLLCSFFFFRFLTHFYLLLRVLLLLPSTCRNYITFTWHRLINRASLFARHDYKGETKRRKELVLAAVIAAFVAVDASRLLAVFLLPTRKALFQPSEIWRFEAGEENLPSLLPPNPPPKGKCSVFSGALQGPGEGKGGTGR